MQIKNSVPIELEKVSLSLMGNQSRKRTLDTKTRAGDPKVLQFCPFHFCEDMSVKLCWSLLLP